MGRNDVRTDRRIAILRPVDDNLLPPLGPYAVTIPGYDILNRLGDCRIYNIF